MKDTLFSVDDNSTEAILYWNKLQEELTFEQKRKLEETIDIIKDDKNSLTQFCERNKCDINQINTAQFMRVVYLNLFSKNSTKKRSFDNYFKSQERTMKFCEKSSSKK